MGAGWADAPAPCMPHTMRRGATAAVVCVEAGRATEGFTGRFAIFPLRPARVRGAGHHALYVNRYVCRDSGVTMDAIELLVGQHRELEARFDAALAAGAEEKQRRFGAIADHLAMHILIEERLFYPAVKERWTEYDLLLSLEEHLSLKRLVADLMGLDGADQTYHPKLKILYDQAAHHHREEENYLFV